jgi:hypothetical protein
MRWQLWPDLRGDREKLLAHRFDARDPDREEKIVADLTFGGKTGTSDERFHHFAARSVLQTSPEPLFLRGRVLRRAEVM